MDATLSDEQEMLAHTAGRVADRLAAASVAGLDRVDPAVGRQLLADAGLLSLRLPADAGGAAASAVEVAIVAEALGRRLCPVPFAGPVIAAELLAAAPAGAQLLATVGSGHHPLTIGVDRALGGVGRHGAEPSLVAWDAAGAEHAAVLVEAVPDAAGGGHHDGPGWRVGLVDVAGTALSSVDLTRQLVALAPADPPAPVGGWIDDDLLQRWQAFALSMLCADMVGVMDGALRMAVAYAAERVQFGRKIGSFQAIQHLCAEQLVSVEAARSATYHAAWAVDGLPPAEALLAARVAKAYVAREAPLVTEAVLQVHGGIGHTWESLAHVFLRRALLDRATLGDEVVHLAAIAAHLRQTPTP